MKSSVFVCVGSVFAAAVSASLFLNGCSRAPAATVSVERGQYLVTIMGCNDCHTPWKIGDRGPEPDMSQLLSGHPAGLTMPPAPALGDSPWVWLGAGTNTAFAGPWGVSYSANLTPAETGLKAWTEETFIKTLRTGWHLGVENSRQILPPMPWPGIGKASDDDLRSIFAYLKSIPPIDNQVPPFAPPAAR